MRRLRAGFARSLVCMVLVGCGPATIEPAKQLPQPAPARPPFADWLAPLIDTPAAKIAPNASQACIGFVDGLNIIYSDGARFIGWALNKETQAHYERFLAVDAAGVIRGGGAGGMSRPDVVASVGPGASPTTGFTIDSTLSTGPLQIFAFDPATGSLCEVGDV